MRKARMTQEERINARVTAMRAHRKSVQRKKAIPAIVTAVCAMAFLAGGTAFGISMINNSKPGGTVLCWRMAKKQGRHMYRSAVCPGKAPGCGSS